MKNLFFIVLVTLLAACASQQSVQIEEHKIGNENDSTAYELVVLEPGFESWFITYSKPVWFHSQDYYKGWNQQYVNAWNYHALGLRYSQLLEGQINYDSYEDYGLKINHKLFYYFQYVVHVLKIPIIPNGPNAI